MKNYSMEDFREKNLDSVYRLVLVASRRAAQINRPESRPLVSTRSKKPTVIALEEIEEGKVSYTVGGHDEEDYLE
jgi:DNA-directed RNA polymerase subunit omega